jgi:predicted Zn-dependent protease with MMP-like domain
LTRTLFELRKSVENLIQQQGGSAPVAAWIYTKEDVMDYPDDDVNVTESVAYKVIENLDDYDHIYTEIFDCIEEELRQLSVLK